MTGHATPPPRDQQEPKSQPAKGGQFLTGADNYLALKARGLSHTRASLTIARRLARRSYHVLREAGPAGLEPITD